MGNCNSIPVSTSYFNSLYESYEFKPIKVYDISSIKPPIIRPVVHNLCR